MRRHPGLSRLRWRHELDKIDAKKDGKIDRNEFAASFQKQAGKRTP
jgi:hypothetical protein